MATTGTATLDFGAFPGASDTSVAVTGQAAIVAGSLVEAWVRPVATADHTDTEHMVETIKVFAANIVAGTGFTIYGFNTSQLNESLEPQSPAPHRGGALISAIRGSPLPSVGGVGTRIYGTFTIAWVWN